MLYIPLKIEINIFSLITQLRKEGVTLLVPFMEGKSFKMVPYRLPLKKKKFGIFEAGDTKKNIKKMAVGIGFYIFSVFLWHAYR